MSRVVAIANQKGGVGKTTTAVNLGASLAVAEQRVLLVDLDPQGNASTGVGCSPGDEDQEGSYELLLGEVETADVIYETEMPYLHVISATQDLVGAERDLLQVDDSATRLRVALDAVRDDYDFIIVDCPPSLGMLTINALTAADIVMVPLQCEYYALEGLSQLVGTIERVRASVNEHLEIHGVVLTMFDSRNNLANEVAAEVRRHFHVYDTIIPRNVRLAEAPSHGKPVILYDASSRGSYTYLNLARELLDDLEAAA
ncbi:MAG: ParA family protein [Deltaproteobacteria bacterium]|nr:ParA family protein [Deltaproteobacteria bacterium]MBW1873966.1 ParA family protein [Deltaproteobacteria bacterium]MBW2210578.1 ParA family protein [Deltaproteobacteria bacterium]MBW2213103.1 ParA family protein [Deltaproteobacteria bacterium]MBW2378942.1 ParA family protein [Deltaproteobacteria bacterium]